MRRAFLLAAIFWHAVFSVDATAAQATVEARLNYLSARVLNGTGTGPFGLQYHGKLTTDEFDVNGELAVGDGETWWSVYVLDDPIQEEERFLYIELNLPLTNANTNSVFDFFEYSRPTSADVSGVFSQDGGGFSPMTAIFNRAASNALGTVTFNFPALGLTMAHNYEILEYRGPYNHTRTGNNLAGTNLLARMDYPEEFISGQMNLTISNINTIAYDDASLGWADQDRGALTLAVPSGVLTRSGSSYFGISFFEDGDRRTSALDYQIAALTLIDTRDQNGNGVPDLTDAATGGGPRPRLSIRIQPDSFILRIEGALDARYDLEFSPSLSPATWSRRQTITMPGTVTEIALARSLAGQGFWRLRVLQPE